MIEPFDNEDEATLDPFRRAIRAELEKFAKIVMDNVNDTTVHTPRKS